MGREVRRVPANCWEHPKAEMSYGYDYQPMFDECYSDAMKEWLENHKLWLAGEHEDQQDLEVKQKYQYYAQWNGNPPDVEFYLWPEGNKPWYQVYETVSEGTPVTPPFETQDELIEYLTTHGDYWNQSRGERPWSLEAAIRFIKGEAWLPSGAMINGVFKDLTQEVL